MLYDSPVNNTEYHEDMSCKRMRIKESNMAHGGIKDKVQQLIGIVKELEKDFPGRHFTLDGHLVGSIGEVMESYYYGIELYAASAVAHDGEIDGKKAQIKITQQVRETVTTIDI